MYLKDSNDRSAVEVLSDHKSQKSLDIGNTILGNLYTTQLKSFTLNTVMLYMYIC